MGKGIIFRTTLAFAVLGPLIGALAVILWLLCSSPAQQDSPTPSNLALLVMGITAWAYSLGFIPAAIAGISWGYIAQALRKTRPLTHLLRGYAGAGLGLICGTAFGLFVDFGNSCTACGKTQLLRFIAPCGALAGMVLCLIYPRARWFKDGPLTNAWSGRES